MMIIINLLQIALVVAFVVDYSGAIDKLNAFVFEKFTGFPYNGWRIPLLSCSLCVTFWVSILFLWINGLGVLNILTGAALNALLVSKISPGIFYINPLKELLKWILKLMTRK